jgi:transcriptional regulator with XRE-family HTH domain
MAVGRMVMGLTQKALGERLGVTELTISKIETGRLNPSDDLRHKISVALKIAAGDVGP